jgi:hypothetical protein
MNSRELLKQCFNCQNNLKCWHLDRQLREGRDRDKIRFKKLSFLKILGKHFLSGDLRKLTFFEYFSIRISLSTLQMNESFDYHEYTQQVMLVLEAIANASNESWCCPADGVDKDEFPESERFSYIPMRGEG